MTKTIHPRRIVDQVTTPTDKKYEPVARMADVIIETTLESGNCQPQDLHDKGFSHQDISTLWHFANALAVIELKCRENGIVSHYKQEVCCA